MHAICVPVRRKGGKDEGKGRRKERKEEESGRDRKGVKRLPIGSKGGTESWP